MLLKISIDQKLSQRIAFKLLVAYNVIPYVGKATAASLNLIGYETIASLKGADPEEMYQKECDVRGQMVDRCQLYMYRMAVYYASSKNPDPKKLKWWIWKD